MEYLFLKDLISFAHNLNIPRSFFLEPVIVSPPTIGPEAITLRQRSQFVNSKEHHGQVFDPMIDI